MTPRKAKGVDTHPVFTRLTEPDIKLLRRLAKRQGSTPSMVVRRLVERHLERERAKDKAKRAVAARAKQDQQEAA